MNRNSKKPEQINPKIRNHKTHWKGKISSLSTIAIVFLCSRYTASLDSVCKGPTSDLSLTIRELSTGHCVGGYNIDMMKTTETVTTTRRKRNKFNTKKSADRFTENVRTNLGKTQDKGKS